MRSMPACTRYAGKTGLIPTPQKSTGCSPAVRPCLFPWEPSRWRRGCCASTRGGSQLGRRGWEKQGRQSQQWSCMEAAAKSFGLRELPLFGAGSFLSSPGRRPTPGRAPEPGSSRGPAGQEGGWALFLQGWVVRGRPCARGSPPPPVASGQGWSGWAHCWAPVSWMLVVEEAKQREATGAPSAQAAGAGGAWRLAVPAQVGLVPPSEPLPLLDGSEIQRSCTDPGSERG